jgi:long-chain fatty acid transport protein
MHLNKIVLGLVAAGFASGAYATNGMNVEGYGPIASGMGGASFAYDNGNAAMMNNPATLGLGSDGQRLDLAIGFLGPDVETRCDMPQCAGAKAKSDGDAYFMPALGWTRKNNNLTYGLGVFAQGGMGTEYGKNTWLGMADGQEQRSELGVGRLIAPIAYNVNQNLTVGGSVDYVWAMLDLKMAMPLSQMGQLITNPGNGTLAGALQNLGMAGYDVARLNFSDDNDFTGKAKGYGWAGKLGFTYKINPMIAIGGTYHTKTNLGDMETSSGGADLIASDYEGFPQQKVAGKITVRDFQWPETYGLGVSVQATPRLMLAADWKRIGWEDVMSKFTMTYSAMGDAVTFQLPQNWEDQNVFQIGAAYKMTDALTLRAGASFADNPIPDATMHYLFPAIEEEHYTAGVGYAFSKASELNFAMMFAPEVEQSNPNFGYTTSHSQLSWQLMYTHRF